VLAGFHRGCDPRIGMHPAQQVHLIGSDLTVRPTRIGERRQITARFGGLLTCRCFAAGQLGVMLGHHHWPTRARHPRTGRSGRSHRPTPWPQRQPADVTPRPHCNHTDRILAINRRHTRSKQAIKTEVDPVDHRPRIKRPHHRTHVPQYEDDAVTKQARLCDTAYDVRASGERCRGLSVAGVDIGPATERCDGDEEAAMKRHGG
jgi:hypothetical protein